MRPFNVEVFDRSFNHKFHDMVAEAEYAFDYLAPYENHVVVGETEIIYTGDFIHISNGVQSYFGIVSSVSRVGYGQMDIGYMPFETICMTQVVFDTSMQSKPAGTSLEQMLADQISALFVTTSDTTQKVSVIRNITALSTTRNWGFNLKADKEGMERCVVNLYDVLMIRSLQKYGVVVKAIPDFSMRKIDFVIGKIQMATKTIEADLPNILSKQIMVRATSASVNKLTVIWSSDFVTSRIYYLHPNGSFDLTDADRISPVVNQIRVIDCAVEEWESSANAQANEVFGEAAYNNLIELEVMNDDELVDPVGMTIGQTVSVIHDGVAYTSILTGKEVRTTTTLTFGCIRLDLTKIIKQGGFNA